MIGSKVLKNYLRKLLLLAVVSALFLPAAVFAEDAAGSCSVSVSYKFPAGYDENHEIEVGLYQIGTAQGETFLIDDAFSAADFIGTGTHTKVEVDNAVKVADEIISGGDYAPVTAQVSGGRASFTGLAPGVYFGKIVTGPSELVAQPFFVTLLTSVEVDVSSKWEFLTSAKVEKFWADDADRDGVRPSSITVQLYSYLRGETEASAKPVSKENVPVTLRLTENEAGKWVGEAVDLPKYADPQDNTAKEYIYIWRETVPEKYTASYADAEPVENYGANAQVPAAPVPEENVWKTDITNTYEPKKKALSVQKIWDDNNNQDGKRPKKLIVHLTADDESVEKIIEKYSGIDLNSRKDLKFTTEKDLPIYVYGSHGKTSINYSWEEEEKIPEYTQSDYYDSSYGGNPEPENGVQEIRITNTHKPGTVSVSVFKQWDDANDQDGIRLPSAVVTLLVNGNAYNLKDDNVTITQKNETKKFTGGNITLTQDGGWQALISGLPEYTNGKKNEYTWSEQKVTGYDDPVIGNAVNGRTVIRNPHTPELVQRTITKVWSDNNNQDGLRPPSVTVTLNASTTGGYSRTYNRTLNASGNWTATITGLPKCDGGLEINYVWTEAPVTGYTASPAIQDEKDPTKTTITNTHTPDKTQITVVKKWNDTDVDPRPEYVTAVLYRNGEIFDQQRLNTDNEWSYTWTDLDVNVDGKTYTYTVDEPTVPEDYIKKVTDDGAGNWTITNTYEPTGGGGNTSVSVEKVWNDSSNADKIRPKSVKVQLYADGKKSGSEVTLDASNKWTYTWSKLARQNSKKEDIKYTVQEVSVPNGYTAKVTGSVKKGFVITNTHTPATGSLSITKQVTVNGAATNTTSADGTYSFRITGPDDYSATVRITVTGGRSSTTTVKDLAPGTYTVRESVPSGTTLTNGNNKTVTVTANNSSKVPNVTFINNVTETTPTPTPGTNVPNTTTPGTNVPSTTTTTTTPSGNRTSVDGQKVWQDESNAHKTRPEDITIHLYADGTEVNAKPTWTSKTGNTWTYSFTNLPINNSSGKRITYTVKEDPVAGYESTVNGTVIVNKLLPKTPKEYISINGVKTWADNANEKKIRPNFIEVELLRNGEKVDSRTVTAANAWAYKFTNIPADDGYGNKYTYTIREGGVEGYYSKVDGYNLVNSLIPRDGLTNGLGGHTEEELEDLIDLFDYDTPLWGGLLGTGDRVPIYPFVFGAIGVAAIILLFAFGKDKNAGKKKAR